MIARGWRVAKSFPTDEAARRLATSREVVIGHIHAGRLKAFNVGRGTRPRWRITEEALAEFMEAQTALPRPKRRPQKRPAKVTEFF